MKITPKSGAGLHKILLRSVMRAPQKFFDETDSGITLNRFSQDMTLIDGSIPNNAIMFFSGIFRNSTFILSTDCSSFIGMPHSTRPNRYRLDVYGPHGSSPASLRILPTEILLADITANKIP